MDYSCPSVGKIIAMDYLYYQFLSYDANSVGERRVVEFHLAKDAAGQENVISWNDESVEAVIVLIEWTVRNS
jgi:hypothetical protein